MVTLTLLISWALCLTMTPTLCAFFLHEWGHWLGARTSGGIVHPAERLTAMIDDAEADLPQAVGEAAGQNLEARAHGFDLESDGIQEFDRTTMSRRGF